MASQGVTNWLLLGIFLLLAAHLFGGGGRQALAETLRLDECITVQMSETPKQYLHVVSHPAP